jgi:peptide/nickel transport system substrate-binding protein
MTVSGPVVSTAVAVCFIVLGACGPAQPARDASSSQSHGGEQQGPKTLTIGIQREQVGFEPELAGAAGGGAGGALQMRPIAQDDLVVPTPEGRMEPRLAVEKPSVERGTWRINPDGTMDLTWKLRPNVKWHDGTPFTSHDVAFGFDVRHDPVLQRQSSAGSGRPDLMDFASTPDPLTVVIHWKQLYVKADEGDHLEPLAAHLLEDAYQSDKDAMTQSRYLSTEFVGLGAYKVVHWEPGSHIEFARFDDYYLGLPKFDRLFLRFIPDGNTLIANVLAGTVDVAFPPDLDAALEVRRQADSAGVQLRADPGAELEQLELQHRPEFARPRNGWTSREARQALYSAIDRKTFVDVMTQGVAVMADSWYAPNDPYRKDVEAFIPQFPYDLSRAQQLMARAGWTRGPDGILVHQLSGERFETEIMHRAGSGAEKEANIIADGWKAIGVQVAFAPLTAQTANDRELMSTRPGPYITSPTGPGFYDRRLHSSQAATAASRWTGVNRGGYSNPKVDDILDRLAIAIDPGQQIDLHRALVQEQMGDIALMPLHWAAVPILMVRGVTGPQTISNRATFHIWQWDKTS